MNTENLSNAYRLNFYLMGIVDFKLAGFGSFW